MNKEDIIKYTQKTPENTNPNILRGMLNALTEGTVVPTGTKSITENGTHDVSEYANAEVNVITGATYAEFTAIVAKNINEPVSYYAMVYSDSANPQITDVGGYLPSGTGKLFMSHLLKSGPILILADIEIRVQADKGMIIQCNQGCGAVIYNYGGQAISHIAIDYPTFD